MSDHRVYPNRVTAFTAGTVTARRLQQALFTVPTAAEIPLVTTAFDGNLDGTIVNVQDLAQAVDDLEAGGGGDGALTEPDLFLAPIEAVAVGALGLTGENKLALTLANAIVNRGGFTVESATSNQAIKVPEDGTYAIDFTLYMADSTASTRSEIRAEIAVIRAAAEATALRTPFSVYYRDNTVTDEFYLSGSVTLDLEADDEIQLLISEMVNTAATFSTGANNSKISVVRLAAAGATTGGQLSGGLTEQVIVGSRLATTEYGLGTLWTAVIDAISPSISPAIDPDNLLHIAVGLRIDTDAAPELIISGAGIRRMTHTSDHFLVTQCPQMKYRVPTTRRGPHRRTRIGAWRSTRRSAGWRVADRRGGTGCLFAFTENAAAI